MTSKTDSTFVAPQAPCGRWTRRGLLAATLGLTALTLTVPATALSQTDNYPERPIYLVIPYPPGGGIDIVGRPLAEKMSKILGADVIVDHRGGASGSIAMQHVARAAPDGYTLVLALNTQMAVNPALYKNLAYHPIRDFEPVALLGAAPYVLVVNPSLPVHSVQDLVKVAKEQPGKLNYASSGTGSGAHLAAEVLKRDAGIDLVHIPHKATAMGVRDVMAGEAHMMFVTFGTVAGHIEAGTLRPIAVSSAQRAAIAPELPTVAEAGFPGFDVGAWYSIFAPAGTPKPIIDKLNAAIRQVLADDEYRDRLARDAIALSGSSPEELRDYLQDEVTKWAKVVQDSGAQLD
ncbi:MAG: tripartite tricarboxylate transporter substrate binding protein [Pigmentiphaga sp.]|nr:tripartite tricarboxylate transporter substrate binding protein [Pigmentiphaga sp.]